MRTTLIAALLCAAGCAFTCGCDKKATPPKNENPSARTESAKRVSQREQAKFEETKAKAEQGDAQAQHNMGHYYAQGHYVAMDWAGAVKWFRKAADQNHVMAQRSLAHHYEQAYGGVENNLVEAYAWRSIVAEPAANPWQGSKTKPTSAQLTAQAAAQAERAVADRDNLAKKMTPQQLADGKKREAELRAQLNARPKGGAK